jgi:ubiquinone/menaquinone biosynthesis C-methylase UbiE
MTRAWLDARYEHTSPEGIFLAHQPVYGYGAGCHDVDAEGRLARLFALLRLLDGLEFKTFLDVGGGDGFVAHVVRRMFGAEVVSGDLSLAAGLRASELFDLPAAAFDARQLPFRDGAFDVVLCSEMIEHVEFPIETLYELERVTGGTLVLTSEEFHPDPAEVARRAAERKDLPHAERNAFSPDDLRCVFGAELAWRRQYKRPRSEPSDLRAWLLASAREDGHPDEFVGGIVTLARAAARTRARRRTDDELVDGLLASFVPKRPLVPRPERPLAPLLARLVACPRCHAALATPALCCSACALAFPLVRGVPDFWLRAEPDPREAELDAALTRRGLDARARAAVLALRRRQEMEDKSTQRAFDFAKPADRAGWTIGPQLEPAGPEGEFDFRSTGPDPWLISPLLVRPHGATAIEVELAISNPAFPIDAADAQLFWLTEGDLDFGEDRALLFRPKNDAQPHLYRLDLAAHPRAPREGEACWLKLDPVNGPGAVRVFALRWA